MEIAQDPLLLAESKIRPKTAYARDNIILIAALVAGLASLLFNWFGTGYAITHILEDEAREKALRWGYFLHEDLRDIDSLFSKSKPTEADLEAIQAVVTAGDIFQYKFYNAHGVIVFASRAEDMGTTIRKPYFYEIVKEGIAYTKIAQKEGLGKPKTFVSEAYIPILKNGIFRGAIEVYSDITKRAEEMFKFRIWAFVALCGFTLLLGALLAIVVVRRKLAQESSEQSLIAEKALKAVNETLEERVSQRTEELEFEIRSHLETEAELVDAMMKTERASKAKSAFLSSVSHELRTPMNAIMGFAQVLQLSACEKLNQRETENVRQIIDNGDKLVNLIDQVLDLSMLEAGHTQTEISQFSVEELLSECAEEFQAAAERNGIKMTTDAGICVGKTATVDRNCLKQALLNLVSNAIKYNKHGGSVKIACACSSDDVFRITIKDTGLGIPAKHHENVFQSFERLGREGQTIAGAGVGLSISKSLVELIKGQIGFESTVGTGSTFWIELPMSDRELIAAD